MRFKSILDKDFIYTPADKTDIRKTWAKARKELCNSTTQAPSKVTNHQNPDGSNIKPLRRER
jgi:hypothetical protein